MTHSIPRLKVVAAALVDAQGRVLIAQRPPGKAQAGRWEFPGGKIAPGETPVAALRRELQEELGVEVGEAAGIRSVMTLCHAYADREVDIEFFIVSGWSGEPVALDGQRLDWVARPDLSRWDVLEADRPFIDWLLSASH